MSSIYEITADYLRIMSMMEDPELDPQTLADTMEAVEGELEVKAENYAKVIANLTADLNAIKVEIDRLTERKKTIENNIKNMKNALQDSMEATGKTKFRTELFNFGIRNNQPAVVIDVDSVFDIPEDYLKYKDPEVDKRKLKEALQMGVDVGGVAHLEKSSSLVIK